jgi:hypothetical protein
MASTSRKQSSAPPRNGVGYLFGILFTTLSVLAAFAIHGAAKQSGTAEKMAVIEKTNRFTEHPIPVRTTYTGIEAVDSSVKFLDIAFMNAVAGWDQAFLPFGAYFLVSFFAIVSVWAVESCRSRSSWLVRLTPVYALFYQTVGGAIIIPIYYLAWLWETSDNAYWTKPRQVPLSYARAILPAVLVGFLLPTILLYLPYSAPDMWTTQAMIILWQPSPWFVDILTWTLSKLFSDKSTAHSTVTTGTRAADLSFLRNIYAAAILVTTSMHFWIVYLCTFSPNPEHSFRRLFLHPTGYRPVEMSLAQGLHAIFQADFWIIFAASVAWAYLAVLDLQRVGIAKNTSLVGMAVSMMLGSLVIGPGAVVAAVWWWREGRMAEAEERIEKGVKAR